MPIIARDNRKEFTPAPEGLHQGVCVDVVDLGLVDGPYGQKHQVEVRWQLDQERDDGRRHMVVKRYTLSLNEKATLRQHLEAWRGRKFSREELEGFDLEKLIGVNGQIQVVHVLLDKGGTWAAVQAIVPLGKGMVRMQPSGDYVRVCDRPSERASSSTHDGAALDPDAEPVPF